MKVVLTEKNIGRIEGMLRKFFTDRTMMFWHQWNVGTKKRYGYIIHIKENGQYVEWDARRYGKHFVVRRRDNNIAISWIDPDDPDSLLDSFEEGSIDEENAMPHSLWLELGSTIQILGNRVQFSVRFAEDIPDIRNLYFVFQIADPDNLDENIGKAEWNF